MLIFYTIEKYEKAEKDICDYHGYPDEKGITTKY